MTGKRNAPTITHDEMAAKWMEDPAFKAEYDAIADEFALLDEMLAARKKQVSPRLKLLNGWEQKPLL